MSIMLQSLALSVLTGWSLAALVAVFRIRKRVHHNGCPREAISVLKPLAGLEAGLEDNLRSFFELTYPKFELVFGVQSPDDPALAIVRTLQERYPNVACRVVVHDRHGLNPKVSNLRAMLAEVTYDWLVISDSNVRVSRDWLLELAAVASEPGTGLAFNLVTAVDGQGLIGELEALHLNTFVAAGCAVPTELMKHPAVLGKSMMFRHSVFAALGGFESVESLLAEDYVIGQMFGAAGYQVRIAPTPVCQVQSTATLRGFIERQLRWAMLRCRLQPGAYLLEPLWGPLPLALLATALGHSDSAWLAIAGATVALRDLTLLALLRPARRAQVKTQRWATRAVWALVIGPLRELLMLLVWACAPFVQHVHWRGRRLKLAAGTRVYLEQPLKSLA